jgi:hypothetical protein
MTGCGEGTKEGKVLDLRKDFLGRGGRDLLERRGILEKLG